jgi:hypothetical protein
MEDPASGDDAVMFAKLRALSRRGAFLQLASAGADILFASGHRRAGPNSMTQVELDQALAAGHIRVSGPGQYTLTRRGARFVRRRLSEKSAAAARMTRAGDARRAVATAARAAPARAEAPRINVQESPLGWLRQRKDRNGMPLISDTEFAAGERLRADFWFAHMTPKVTSSWNPASNTSGRQSAPGTGTDMADSVLAARERVARALAAVGPELSGVLVDVCCHLQGLERAERASHLPQRSGKVVLQLALRSLARHYGLDRRGTSGTRHWGSPGFRPELGDTSDASGVRGGAAT